MLYPLRIFNSIKLLLGFIVLTALGVLGNTLNVSLFFGVDVIFGSIATLLVIAAFGVGWGLIATIIAAAYTYFLWNHPFAGAVLVCEGLYVGLMLKRFRSNLPLTVGSFWILVGMPLVWVLYTYGLKLDQAGVILAALKQGANGIFNSIISGLILTHTPFLQKVGVSRQRHIPVFQNIFNIFVATALIPMLFIIIVEARNTLRDVEDSASARLDTISTGISLSIERWLSQHVKAIVSVSTMAEKIGAQNQDLLQKLVINNKVIWPDFSILRDGFKGPYISNVFMARGGVFQPVFNVASPIRKNGKFLGIAASSINLEQVAEILHYAPGKTGFVATLIDRDGNIIISDNSNYKPLTKYEDVFEGVREELPNGLFYHRPKNSLSSPMLSWNHSLLGRKVKIPGTADWQLVVEIPMSPIRALLYDKYIRSMAFLVCFVLIILLGSIWTASRISRPLAQLSTETTNLPERLKLIDSVRWPTSKIIEINVLVENFKSMVVELKRRFSDLESSREQLVKAKNDAETANLLKTFGS